MQVLGMRDDPEFNPIRLSILMESIEEVRAIYAIFNSTPIAEFLREQGIDAAVIRKAIMHAIDDHEVSALRHMGPLLNKHLKNS